MEKPEHREGAFFLGIDVGTSKTAAALVDPDANAVVAASEAHDAAIVGLPPERAEQDPARLRQSVWRVVSRLPAELRSRTAGIGVTGQMHGVLLLDAEGEPVSPLVTWQDARCRKTPEFLAGLESNTGYPLRAGFGAATLAWLVARGQWPDRAVAACTIHDWIVAGLCGATRPVTDPTDAASVGLFDLATGDWDAAAVRAAGIPPECLPRVRPCGTVAGHLAREPADGLGLPPDVPVTVAIGDNQASLLATLSDPERELGLTLGTGGQLSAVLAAGGRRPELTPRFEFRPYPGGRLAAVAATLNGGSAWSWLAGAIEGWLRDMGAPPLSRDRIFEQMNRLGQAADTEIDVSPVFAGERFDPARRGRIDGLDIGGMGLGPLARGLARGILTNLHDMLPGELLCGRRRLVGSGNALRRNTLLRCTAEEVFGLPLHVPDREEEAATGAALLAAEGRQQREEKSR